ncbi:hypothetical protein Q5716_13390 [Protaetiibacter sp. WY-16]|uniref:DUF559 domain-containing protein n=1 Tax=Antiquaquibacter soli TaxID=3064523 RepID=A0ABT9BUZ5_9MICO|nr:hypothetical protein [Protaetiibacter sp. WY-16]
MSVATSGFAFSHGTAAVLYGMAVPRRVEQYAGVHVAVSSGQPRRAGVTTHRLQEMDVRYVDGLPVVVPERVWLQLATTLTRDELVVAGDSLVRRKRPLSTMSSITSLLTEARGARGVRRAAAALELVRAGTDSPKETELRLMIVASGLPEPVIGHTVHHEGYWVGTPDLAYVRERIAIEYQGGGHRAEDVFEEDIARAERFRAAGWEFIQVTKRQLRNSRSVTERIRVALRGRGSGRAPA